MSMSVRSHTHQDPKESPMFAMSPVYRQRLTRLKEKGVTLIELLIGIGVISVMALIVFMYLGGVLSKTTTDEASKMLSGVVAETRLAFKDSVVGLTEASIVNNKLAPKDMISAAAGTLRTPYADNAAAVVVTASAGDPNVGNGPSVQLVLGSIPSSDCSNLVRSISPFSDRILVGAAVVKAYQASIDKEALGTSCAAMPATGGTITLVSRIR